MKEYKLSIFKNTFQTKGSITLLEKELKDIKEGKYKSEIENCRTALIKEKNIEKYKTLKKQLPAVTFCGLFEHGRRLNNLVFYNKLIVIDIDSLSASETENLKQTLITDDYIAAIWKSPSSLGLKGIIKINSTTDNHKAFFSSLSIYFYNKYGIKLDKSGSDITRLCYVSWDKDIYINFNSNVFDELLEADLFEEKKSKTGDSKQPKKSHALLKSAYATEGMNDSKNKKQIKKIINFLSSRGLSITVSFHDWVRVAFVVANSFSYDIGENFFLSLCRLDKENHDEFKSKELLKYCYNNRNFDGENKLTFATIVYLANKKGFIVK